MKIPRVMGHRGALALAPENTLAGIRLAASFGVEGVEFDVKLTADGCCVVFHDDRLERTTDGCGAVAETPLDDFSDLDAGSWFSPAFAGERVPTLEDVIGEVNACDLFADIEIKPCPGRAVETARTAMSTIECYWPEFRARPLVTSFDLSCLEVAGEMAPDWPRGIICLRLAEDWLARLAAVEAKVLVCHESGLEGSDVAALREQGITVVAYPINDVARAAQLVDWGVSSLISNSPERLLSAPQLARC